MAAAAAVLNVPQALVNFILGKMQQSMISQWMKFIFELIFSAVTSYYLIKGITAGGMLKAGISPAIAIASGVAAGDISIAVSMVYLFRKESTRLTQGMLVALPAEEAKIELDTNMQTIQKQGEKK